MSTQTQIITEDIRGNSSLHQTTVQTIGTKSLHPYAWLEYEAGFWHFLTSPFADPDQNMRKWSDKQEALDELAYEGWVVVRAYPENISENFDKDFFGYGLQRLVN
jgi:hypothetical protein